MANSVKPKRNKSVATGLVIVSIGVIWLLRKAGVYLPDWLFSWEMLLIGIGIAIGIDNRFNNPASYILIAIGGFFLIDDLFYIPVNVMDFFWPALVIVVGLIIIFQAYRSRRVMSQGPLAGGGEKDNNARLDNVSVFNGTKKQVTSKAFSGGEVVTVFGGTEVSFMQADFEGMAQLDVTVVFGGAKLIIPKNWEVRTEVTSIFGGVDDKRHSAVEVLPDEKVLIITGTVLFGGLDIVNY